MPDEGCCTVRRVNRKGAWPTCESLGLAEGQRWAYLLTTRTTDIAEVVVRRCGTKRPSRALVEFVDDSFEGRREWVPPSRLVCRWDDSPEWVESKCRWTNARVLSKAATGTVELTAAYSVLSIRRFEPVAAVAEEHDNAGVLVIADIESLSAEYPVADLEARPGAFRDGDTLVVPWPAAMDVARRLAERHSEEVLLECVLSDEDKAQKQSVLGDHDPNHRFWPNHHTERSYYRHLLEVHHLLRCWCDATEVERIDQISVLRREIERLEAETRRLLVTIQSTIGRPMTERRFTSICSQLKIDDYSLRGVQPYRYTAMAANSRRRRSEDEAEQGEPLERVATPSLTMTQREVAAYAGVSRYAIRRWTAAGLVPHFAGPSGPTYGRARIEQWYLEERDTIARGGTPSRENSVLLEATRPTAVPLSD